MANKSQITKFFATIGPLAVQVCKERGYGNAQAWTCMAQAACESAYGTSKIMANANAYFGIKASASWVKKATYGGLVYNSKTQECYDGKTYTNITACFRAYKSMLDSVRDYFDLMEASRYKASLKAENVNDCITLIKKGGYATSPTYISTINNIYVSYKELIEAHTVASTASSASTSTATAASTSTTTAKAPSFVIGKTYVLQAEMKVRTGAGTKYPAKKYGELTANGRKYDKDKDGALDKGTLVTCQKTETVGSDVWMKCPSGWIAAYYKGVQYIK